MSEQMTRFRWALRYIRWWKGRLPDWNRRKDVPLFREWAECWIDDMDALRDGLDPEDAAYEDASNA